MSGHTVRIELTVNGQQREAQVHPMTRLLDVLRENLRLTGTKEGCGEGECGACSIFINGELVNSCLVPAIQVQGAVIQTIEGVSSSKKYGSKLHGVQEAFLGWGGAQCGICTPGMIMAAVHLIENTLDPTTITENQIRTALAGNLCRCTGYTKIFEAVQKACHLPGSKA